MIEKQFAIVDGDKVLHISALTTRQPDLAEYAASFPAATRCLPIENRDSQPFDPEKHWRYPPHYVVQADCVHRVYDIRDKDAG